MIDNSPQSLQFVPGVYMHYKGKRYRALMVACHSETNEPMVVYEALYDNDVSKIWVRPLAMFLESVEVDGILMPRFRRIRE